MRRRSLAVGRALGGSVAVLSLLVAGCALSHRRPEDLDASTGDRDAAVFAADGGSGWLRPPIAAMPEPMRPVVTPFGPLPAPAPEPAPEPPQPTATTPPPPPPPLQPPPLPPPPPPKPPSGCRGCTISANATQLQAQSCCSAHDRCGLTFPQLSLPQCFELNTPGRRDTVCPDLQLGGGQSALGCCRPDGSCGVFDPLFGLGCLQLPYGEITPCG